MQSPRFKPIYLLSCLSICLSGFAIAYLITRGKPPAPVDARPDVPLATFMLPDNYVFRQDDGRWASETIGNTTDSLAAYGCTIASVAMAASNLMDSEITPIEMETRLTQVSGFTGRGWLIWDKVSEATNGQVSARYFDNPNHSDINSCMEAGNYPVVKIKLYDSIIHWVTIVGRTKDQYLIRDPLVGSKEDRPIKLSDRSQDIFGVRCIYKN